jgi:hypothetical protein
VVQATGLFFALPGFLLFLFIWAVPESLITAELSTMIPGNGGYVVLVDRAFGPFAGSLIGKWKYVCRAISWISTARAWPAAGLVRLCEELRVRFRSCCSVQQEIDWSVVDYPSFTKKKSSICYHCNFY